MKPSESIEPKSDSEMSGAVVVQLLQHFDQHGTQAVVDGGWGVDAIYVDDELIAVPKTIWSE